MLTFQKKRRGNQVVDDDDGEQSEYELPYLDLDKRSDTIDDNGQENRRGMHAVNDRGRRDYSLKNNTAQKSNNQVRVPSMS
jgi:hypothetical protein